MSSGVNYSFPYLRVFMHDTRALWAKACETPTPQTEIICDAGYVFMRLFKDRKCTINEVLSLSIRDTNTGACYSVDIKMVREPD